MRGAAAIKARLLADADGASSALDSISLEFLGLIANPVAFDPTHYLCFFGAGILQEDFYEVIKDDRARAILGDNPYRLAYDFAFIQSARLMKELGEGWGGSFCLRRARNLQPVGP